MRAVAWSGLSVSNRRITSGLALPIPRVRANWAQPNEKSAAVPKDPVPTEADSCHVNHSKKCIEAGMGS